jgi:hypothetical protein
VLVAQACNPPYSRGEIGRITVQSQPRQIVGETFILKKPITKTGLVEWLKVKALSSNSSTPKNKKQTNKKIKTPKS